MSRILLNRRGFLVGAGAFPALITATAGNAEAPVEFNWRFQTLWAADSINMAIFSEFCDRVAAMSGNRLVIEPLPNDAVVGPFELFDAVQAGILDGQNGGGSYVADGDVAFALFGDLAGAYDRPDEMQAWYEHGGGRELARELYGEHGTYHVGLVWHGMESLVSKTPIKRTDDFEGIKMRAPAGAVSAVFEHFGGRPVELPGSEIYASLQSGLIDAADWGTLSMNVDQGFQTIAPYALYPGFHSMPATDIVVNMERWHSLPSDLKEILTVATRDYGREMHQRLMVKDEEIAAVSGDLGLTLIDWPKSERRKFREVAAQVWRALSADSPAAKRIVESQADFLKKLGRV